MKLNELYYTQILWKSVPQEIEKLKENVFNSESKGQLISKANSLVLIQRNYFLISALASKKNSYQKTLSYNYVNCP